MLPLLFGLAGAAAPFIEQMVNGGKDPLKRIEDPITTQALQQMGANRERTLAQNPEAMRRMTQMLLLNQQQGAMQGALGATGAQLQNQGVGGSISAPMLSALMNSQGAISASGQFAGAMASNNQNAMQNRMQQDSLLQQISEGYGQQAQHVNLIDSQYFGGRGNNFLKALYGASNFTGLGQGVADILKGRKDDGGLTGTVKGA